MRRARTPRGRRRVLAPALLGVALAILLAALVLGVRWPFSGERVHPPGVLVAEPPQQIVLPDAEPLMHGEYELRPRAGFRIEARVLSQAIYRFDAGAGLAPVDLLLGWQRMSDSAVLAHFRFSQSARWGRWRVEEWPIPESEVVVSAANMHMIPADAAIERRLRNLRHGDLVRIEGLLVDARRERDDWRWNTSLSRNDRGHGACELVFVQWIELW